MPHALTLLSDDPRSAWHDANGRRLDGRNLNRPGPPIYPPRFGRRWTHLILLGILIAGIYSIWQGREKLGAMWFGLVIALKVTPALFLLFFLWKRRWRLAGYTAMATICWILLPALYMGPSWWWSQQREWTQVAVGSILGHESPATRSNEQQVRNQSLQQTLLRYLVTIPEDHPLRQKDPGYVPVLNLPPATAKLVVQRSWRAFWPSSAGRHVVRTKDEVTRCGCVTPAR